MELRYLRVTFDMPLQPYQINSFRGAIVAKTQFLEHLLQSYILSFASGIGWFVADPIETRISEIKAERYIEIKHNHVLGFTLRFKTNVDLPDYIGLGRAAARGLGMVRLFNSQSPIYKKDLIK